MVPRMSAPLTSGRSLRSRLSRKDPTCVTWDAGTSGGRLPHSLTASAWGEPSQVE